MASKKQAKAKARGPGRLSTEETAAMEERLLDAAEAVFLEQGFARATMDAVSKASGATRKTLYARYANKEELFAAVVARLIDSGITAPRVESRMPNADPRTQLIRLAHDLVDFAESPRVARISRLVFAEGHQAPELIRLLYDLYDREIASVSAVLHQLTSEGHLPGIENTRLPAVMFMELVSSTARMRGILGPAAALPRKQVEAYVSSAVDLFLAGYSRR